MAKTEPKNYKTRLRGRAVSAMGIVILKFYLKHFLIPPNFRIVRKYRCFLRQKQKTLGFEISCVSLAHNIVYFASQDIDLVHSPFFRVACQSKTIMGIQI